MKKVKGKKNKAKKTTIKYDKKLTTKGMYNFGELVDLAMSGNPKPKKV